jgi:hypothetical protein
MLPLCLCEFCPAEGPDLKVTLTLATTAVFPAKQNSLSSCMVPSCTLLSSLYFGWQLSSLPWVADLRQLSAKLAGAVPTIPLLATFVIEGVPLSHISLLTFPYNSLVSCIRSYPTAASFYGHLKTCRARQGVLQPFLVPIPARPSPCTAATVIEADAADFDEDADAELIQPAPENPGPLEKPAEVTNNLDMKFLGIKAANGWTRYGWTRVYTERDKGLAGYGAAVIRTWVTIEGMGYHRGMRVAELDGV